MTDLLTYWRTLRHLRPVQLYGRAYFHLARPRTDLRTAPPLRERTGDWAAPARRKASMLGPERFFFLNEVHDLPEAGWDDPVLPKLWRYNLHYFDDLNACDAAMRADWHRAVLTRWLRENPPARGSGWEPYPTSLRIVNWIKWALAGNALAADARQSLAVQSRWLCRRIERHLLGNHLFSNAKALVFAGLFFDGPEANSWLDMGMRILDAQVPEQIMADGGHFERSTMYQSLALEDIADLCNAGSAYVRALPARWKSLISTWQELLSPMRHWLATMCHPDGQISFFNDAAFGVAPSPAELESYVQRLGEPPPPARATGISELRASGYIRIEHDDAVAILDVAQVGPDYLPAHAHADTLSFEMSIVGQRVFVNSGTSQYGAGIERGRQRGTAAHNTVVVDGHDSSEVWSAFRVARRARPAGLVVERTGVPAVRCAHDGYRRLRGDVEHTRTWSFSQNAMVVEDQLSGKFDRAEARFHVHPALRVEAAADAPRGRVSLRLPEGRAVHVTVEGGALRIDSSTWHPEFGLSVPNVCVVAEFHGPVLRTSVNWDSTL
jgi:uncharacterized heparinase superfamily protein